MLFPVMLVVVLLSMLGFVHGMVWTDPVNTTSGLVRGVVEEDLTAYRGIPYAHLDKEKPFGLSSPHPYMDEVFDAVDDSDVCPQREEYNRTIVGSLDCLHLNVYVPHGTTLDSKLPVMVYIYGGGFNIGFSREILYGPKFLVPQGIIMVIFNYRLGPYGFMCLDTEEYPGNQGLKDQVLAIQWVENNIAAFGGDVDNISLMGNSAGGISAELHLLSPMPKLFHKVILQSGVALLPRAFVPSDPTAPLKLAEHLGFKTDNINEALSFLTKTHTDLVMAAALEMNLIFLPCVEKEFNNVERFIHVHPWLNDLATTGDIKILAGFTSHETLTRAIEAPDTIDDSNFPGTMLTVFDTTDMSDMIRKVRRFYIGDDIINEQTSLHVLDFVSDFAFNYPVYRSVVNYVNNGSDVFLYMFAYNGNRNFMTSRTVDLTEKDLSGAVHGDELGYLFDMIFFPDPPNDEDQVILDRMTTMWTNFMKFGDPTPSQSDLIPLIWPPATKDVMWCLNIDSDLTLSRQPYHARMSFWDLFFAANEDKLLVQASSSHRLISSLVLLFLSVLIY